MPISDIQAKVLKLIAANRSPESYLAGATVINRAAKTPRFSQDLDFFHDIADSIAQSADRDADTLSRAGYEVQWLLRTATFHRAVVAIAAQRLKIEWAQDSAFRFFPVQPADNSATGFTMPMPPSTRCSPWRGAVRSVISWMCFISTPLTFHWEPWRGPPAARIRASRSNSSWITPVAIRPMSRPISTNFACGDHWT
jgi:hypothetical protein